MNVTEEKSSPINLEKTVVDAVLERLGKPENLHSIKANAVGEDRFRVNIYLRSMRKDDGDLFETVTIPHSYYVVASPEGGIVSSWPAIERKYQ